MLGNLNTRLNEKEWLRYEKLCLFDLNRDRPSNWAQRREVYSAEGQGDALGQNKGTSEVQFKWY